MINDICKSEVKEFLKQFPRPSVITASTIKKGFVVCIGPVNTICGPELMCGYDDSDELHRLISCLDRR